MSFYADIFRELQPKYDPRHIEAFVRMEHGTLDHLDPEVLRHESEVAAACIDESGPGFAEAIAHSLGM